MTDLDRPETYETLDPTGMRRRIAAFPEHGRNAWLLTRDWQPPASFRTPRRVVVVGMGGSAIGADVVATLAARRVSVPVQVHRSPSPPVVDADTLVVASSHSGGTGETLAAFTGTFDQPGMRLAITTGGALAEIAGREGIPALRYAHEGEPRSALGYGIFLLLGVLDRLGLAVTTEGEVGVALSAVARRGQEWCETAPSNQAKELARAVRGEVPIVMGDGMLQVAALRWQNQFNENAKQWAFHAAMPELAHNLVEAFDSGAAQPFHALMLASDLADDQAAHRVSIIAEQLREAGVAASRVHIEAGNELEALVTACHLGDWVSLYAALLDGVDPSPVLAIGRFKEALGAAGGAR